MGKYTNLEKAKLLKLKTLSFLQLRLLTLNYVSSFVFLKSKHFLVFSLKSRTKSKSDNF